MNLREKLLVVILVLLCWQPAFADEPVSLQLKWRHAFQFAGFYMALEKGYYRDEGLDVTISEGGPDTPYIDHVLQPGANYSVADSSALLARATGKPVKAIAAIFQHSPLALLVLKSSGIKSFEDLRGKRIMMQPDLNADLLATLGKAGIGKKDFIHQNISYDIHDLIDGKTDAYAAYTTDQPHQLDRLGIPYRILRPGKYGIDFYGDILITSDWEVRRHSERVNAMVAASVKGWMYALNHPDEAIDLILKKYNSRHLTPDQLYYEADMTAKMIMKDMVQVGYMSSYRWQRIADAYAGQGLIPKEFAVSDLIYRPAPGLTDMLEHYRWQLAVSGLALLFLAMSLHAYVLRRTVKSRTRTLRENEERFRTLVDNIPGAIFRSRFGAMRDIDFISGEIEAISGYGAEEFLSGLRRFDDIVHPDDISNLEESIQLSVRTGLPYSIEYRMARKDGGIRWVLEKGQGIFDEHDQFQWIDGNIIDIDARKRGEELLQVTSEILEMIAGNIATDHIFARIVETFERRQPGTRASVLLLRGDRLYKAAAPNLPDAYNELIEGVRIGPMTGSCGTAAYNKKRAIAENILEDERWADYADAIKGFPMRSCWSEPIFDADGGVLGTFAMYHDTPRTPNEEEINDIGHAARLASIVINRDRNLEKLRMLSLAVEQTGEVIMIADNNGILEYINPAFSKQTGYSPEEAIGKKTSILNSGRQDAAFYEQMWETIKSGATWQGKIIEKRKSGDLYPAMMTISPLRNEKGEISHYVGVHEDLTELHHMEAQFHQAQKMETIGTLVGGIAHDFNNMLAGITGNLYIAKAQIEESSRALKPLENIDHIAMRASDIVKQLLTFANKGLVEKRTFPLTPLLKEAVKLQRVSIPENIKFEIDLCTEDLPVFADASQLQQITLNLLTNARDATADVEVPAISIKLTPFNADKAFLAKHPQLKTSRLAHLQVADNGHGIKPEHIHNVFEPFFTTKEVGKGTGLGLAMVFGAVQSNGGVIAMESEPDLGTTFHIYLPLADQAGDDTDKPQTKPDIRRGEGELILLADDDPLVIESSSEVLQALGYSVLTADNGSKAVEIFRDHSDIRLVMLDVVMPVMNGPKAADEIRRLNPEARIIFATGYDRDAALAGTDGLTSEIVLTKPFTVAELSGVLRDQLSASGA